MIGQCSIPLAHHVPQQADPVGPYTVHLYLLTNNFHTHVFIRIIYMYIFCAKLFAVYACLHGQLGGASDSPALRTKSVGLKHFCGYPTLLALSTSFPTGQVNTIGVVYKCACMSTQSISRCKILISTMHVN